MEDGDAWAPGAAQRGGGGAAADDRPLLPAAAAAERMLAALAAWSAQLPPFAPQLLGAHPPPLGWLYIYRIRRQFSLRSGFR